MSGQAVAGVVSAVVALASTRRERPRGRGRGWGRGRFGAGVDDAFVLLRFGGV